MAITALTHPFATASSSPRAVRFRSVAGRVPGALVAVLVASVDGRAAMGATDPATAAHRQWPGAGHVHVGIERRGGAART